MKNINHTGTDRFYLKKKENIKQFKTNDMQIIEEYTRERELKSTDKFFVVKLDTKTPLALVEIGYIESEFKEKKFRKSIKKETPENSLFKLHKLEIKEVIEFDNEKDYLAYKDR